MSLKVFANRNLYANIISFLSIKGQDGSKSVSRLFNTRITELQRREIMRKIPEDFVRGFGKERLERVPICNKTKYLVNQHGRRCLRIPLSLKINADEVCLMFAVDCHARGICCGSLVVHKSYGAVIFRELNNMRTTLLEPSLKKRILSFLSPAERIRSEGVSTLSKSFKSWDFSFALPNGKAGHAPSQLSKLSRDSLFHFLRGGSLVYKRAVEIFQIEEVWHVERSFDEDEEFLDNCCCSLFRCLFFSGQYCDTQKSATNTLKLSS